MANIKVNYGDGGEHLNPKGGTTANPALATVLRDMADDFETIRANLNAFNAKLDTDFVAQNAAVTSSQLDVDYATTHDIAPAGILTKKV